MQWLSDRGIDPVSTEQEFLVQVRRRRRRASRCERVRPDVRDALRAHEVVDAIYRSAADGGVPVELPRGGPLMRLGVAAALVDGELVPRRRRGRRRRHRSSAVGRGRGRRRARSRCPGWSTCRSTVWPAWTCVPPIATGYADGGAGAGTPRRHRGPADLLLPAARARTAPRWRRLGEVLADPPPGCRLLPAHLEGPFLSPARQGAHRCRGPRRARTSPSLERLLALGPGRLHDAGAGAGRARWT